MKDTLENREKAVSYLLGELSAAERDSLEERLFLDEDFSLLVADIENDLIDEYVGGELQTGEKLKFESAYLTNDARRSRVRAAQVLQAGLFAQTQAAENLPTEPKVSFWESVTAFFRQPGFLAAGGLAVFLLFLLGALWFLISGNIDNDRVILDNTNESFPAPRETPEEDLPVNNQNANDSPANAPNINKPPAESNKSEIKPNKPEPNKTTDKQKEVSRPPQRVFAFTLLPPTRSSERAVLKIPENAKRVRLRIINNFEKSFAKYTVEIAYETGETVLKQDFSSIGKRPKKSFALDLPGQSLKSGAYEITLLGVSADGDVEEINFYGFTVK